jgi:hypothetical protein
MLLVITDRGAPGRLVLQRAAAKLRPLHAVDTSEACQAQPNNNKNRHQQEMRGV